MKIVYQKIKNTIRVRSVHSLSSTAHFHAHIELLYLLSGSAVATANNEVSQMKPGDLFVSFPDQIHFYQNFEPINAILIILPADYFDEYSKILDTKIPRSAVLPAEKCNFEIKSLIEQIYMNSYSKNPYKPSIIKGYALALMGKMLEHAELQDNVVNSNDTLHEILTYCKRNYKNSEFDLQALSDEVHRNRHYISHVFNEKINMSFTDYINSLRIDEACRLINKGGDTPISEIAYEVGFGSIRTFNRAFLKFKNIPPSEFKIQK